MTQHFLRELGVVAAGATLSLVITIPAQAATFSLSFEQNGWSGIGQLSFNNSSLTGVGEETVTLANLIEADFSYNVFKSGVPIASASDLSGVSFKFENGTLTGFTHTQYFNGPNFDLNWGNWYYQEGTAYMDLFTNLNLQILFGADPANFFAYNSELAYSEKYYWDGSQRKLYDPDGDGKGDREYTQNVSEFAVASYQFETVEPVPEPTSMVGLAGLAFMGLARLKKKKLASIRRNSANPINPT